MGRKRIRYMLRAFPDPSGGCHQSRRHVKMLADAGYDAAIVTNDLSDAHFYNMDVPTLLESDFNITSDDILVIPEGWHKHFKGLKDTPAEKLCFCQNHFYVHKGFAPGQNFESFSVKTVLCCSRIAANHIERYYGVKDIHVIPCGIDLPEVVPDRKYLNITFMPRKAGADALVIQDIFRRQNHDLAQIRWVSVDKRSHAEAIGVLADTAIFLSLSYREGFGLPPIEAMSVRTLVVGFHGDGGREYATPRNGYWLDEGDLVGCAAALARAVRMRQVGSREVIDVLDEAQATAARFSIETTRAKLLAFWSERV